MNPLGPLGGVLGLGGVWTTRLGLRPLSIGALVAATGIVAAALSLRLALGSLIAGAQFITFIPAVMATTLLFGAPAGIWSVLLSVIAAKFVMDAEGLTSDEGVSLIMYALVAALEVAVIGALLGANSALKRSVAEVATLNSHLRHSEAKFRDLLESAPDAIVMVDRNDRIALVNAET